MEKEKARDGKEKCEMKTNYESMQEGSGWSYWPLFAEARVKVKSLRSL